MIVGTEAFVGKYMSQIDVISEDCVEGIRSSIYQIFVGAGSKLEELRRSIPEYNHPDTQSRLEGIMGHVSEEAASSKVVLLRFAPLKYGRPSDENPGLKVLSIPEGFVGFNTSRPDQDNTKRWIVDIDRGTNFGAAYDARGTAYAHGRFEPSRRHTIAAPVFDKLVGDFCSRPYVVPHVEVYDPLLSL